jgi:hypothetical protein
LRWGGCAAHPATCPASFRTWCNFREAALSGSRGTALAA